MTCVTIVPGLCFTSLKNFVISSETEVCVCMCVGFKSYLVRNKKRKEGRKDGREGKRADWVDRLSTSA